MKSTRITTNEGSHRHEIDQKDDDDDMMIDYISNLPDCILHHILSFLPTKQVVKTSKLSKRWKTMWLSVPNLHFDDSFLLWYLSEDNYEHYLISFLNSIERILSLRGASSKVDKFRLSCSVYYNPSRITSWVSNVIMHDLKELDIRTVHEHAPKGLFNYSSVIPQSVFICKSLVILKIVQECPMEIPSRVSLPCLKTLHLGLVHFFNDDSTKNLFSSCPVIEELVLSECDFIGLETITISSLTLKRLTIYDLPDDGYKGLCEINIDANNLTDMEYIGALSNQIFLINSVPSQVKAFIHIPYLWDWVNQEEEWDGDYREEEDDRKDVVCCAVGIFERLQNIVFLSVSNCTMECLTAGCMLDHFPVFQNLTHLVLTRKILNDGFRGFMHFLNYCPTLQSINLSEGFQSCMRLGENDSIWLLVPICVSYHLKTLTLNNFQADDSEIRFLKCILKYARVLEKMNVSWCKIEPRDMKKQRDVRKELETAEKSSAACIIKFL